MKQKMLWAPLFVGAFGLVAACNNSSGGSGNNNTAKPTVTTPTVKPKSDVLDPITITLKDGRKLTFSSQDYLKQDNTYTSDSMMYLVQGGGTPKTYMVVGYAGNYDNGEGFIGTNGLPTKTSNLPKGETKFNGQVRVVNHDRFLQTRSADNYHGLADEVTKLNGDAQLTANFDSGAINMYIGTLSGESTIHTERDSSNSPGLTEDTRTDTVDPIAVNQTVSMGQIWGNRFEGKPVWDIQGDAYRYFNSDVPTRVRGGFYDENGETAMATFYSGTGRSESEKIDLGGGTGSPETDTWTESTQNYTIGTFVGTRK